MRTQFDQFAKSLLEKLLCPVGTVRSQYEVRSTAQAVDMWFEPAPDRAAERTRLGALARVSEETCMLEPFHNPPGLSEVRACIRKQYNLAHFQALEARAAQKAAQKAAQTAQSSGPDQQQEASAAQTAQSSGPDQQEALETEAVQGSGPGEEQEASNEALTTEVPFPRLWIISAGRPETVLARYEMRRMDVDTDGDENMDEDGWLRGFWQAADGHALHVMVLRDLPETPDTLLLRLLGTGKTHARAVDELVALPRDSWQYLLAMPLLLAFRFHVPPGLYDDSEGNMQYTEKLDRLYAAWEQRVKRQGLEQGLEQGRELAMRSNIIDLYEVRFGSMPEDMRTALARVQDPEALRRILIVTGTRTAKDVSEAVREADGAG
jgi:hypothetical protein